MASAPAACFPFTCSGLDMLTTIHKRHSIIIVIFLEPIHSNQLSLLRSSAFDFKVFLLESLGIF